jgi:diaminopimelate decarboxylase
MDYFNYRDDQLFAEDVAIADIVAEHGSPCYIYSKATLERHWHAFDSAFGQQAHLICYAVKCCFLLDQLLSNRFLLACVPLCYFQSALVLLLPA